jgi:hypothetical protein
LAGCHFLRPVTCADEQKIDEIDRANEQEKKHASLEQEKCRPNRPHVLRVEQNHQRAKPSLGHRLRPRVVPLDRGVMGVDL